MSLARAWRRQLYGASGVALIFPSAMLAALVVLALGGGFSQVGVLGQIFAGPPALGAGAASGGGGGSAARVAARSLPVIPAVAISRRPARRFIPAGGPSSPGVSRQTGGAGAAPIVTGAPIRSTPRPGPGAPSRPAQGSGSSGSGSPGSESPSPTPQPKQTLVDPVVTVVTQVTQQLPPPVGPAATQAVQAAGSAADGILPAAPSRSLP
jgi:hypothetical protein